VTLPTTKTPDAKISVAKLVEAKESQVDTLPPSPPSTSPATLLVPTAGVAEGGGGGEGEEEPWSLPLESSSLYSDDGLEEEEEEVQGEEAGTAGDLHPLELMMMQDTHMGRKLKRQHELTSNQNRTIDPSTGMLFLYIDIDVQLSYIYTCVYTKRMQI